MSRTTNNASQSIDYIDTIALIGEPFQSSLLDKYPEYLAATDETKTTTFLGALNLIGQNGCKFIYDKVINYIDDVSNVDTCKLDALYSTATTLQVPYKDKQTIEILKSFVGSADILQLLVWLMSCNVRNSKHIAKRLELIPDDADLTNVLSHATLFAADGDIAIAVKQLLKNIITKRHIAPPGSQNDTNMLLNYTWNFFNVIIDVINSNQMLYTKFMYSTPCVHKVDFGKYNFTNHEHTCAKLLKLKLNSVDAITTETVKNELPFLFNTSLFDPIQAAESILYTSDNISAYTIAQQTEIAQCITAINTTGQYVLDTYATETLANIKWINRLNTHTYADERVLNTVMADLKTVLNIDPLDYITIAGTSLDDITPASPAMTWWTNTFSEFASHPQFDIISSLSTEIDDDDNIAFFDVDRYVSDIYDSLLSFATKVLTVREDLKLLTLRNALKGTSAIIQLATAEYLNEHLPDIVDNVIDDVIPEQYRLSVKSDAALQALLTTVYDDAILDPSDVTIKEYWDTTEYFGRTKDDPTDDYPADWNTSPATVYGSTSVLAADGITRDSSDIVRFYTNTLGLNCDTFKASAGESDVDLSTDAGMAIAQTRLINFLNGVYNAGIYSKVLPSNIEKIFSGNPTNAVLRQFYTNFKTYSTTSGKDRISKQIHPYIWNFTTNENSLQSLSTPGTYSNTAAVDSSGSVTSIQQDTDIVLLDELITSIPGNILNQWRLNISKYIDDSNYRTRYEAYDHTEEDRLICYDGYVYPPFAKDMLEYVSTSTDILATQISGESVHRKWYKRFGNQLLRSDVYDKENKILAKQLRSIQESVDPTIYAGVPLSSRTTMQNFAVDNAGASYAVTEGLNGDAVVYYKEAAYPFMRPLRQTTSLSGTTEQLGVTIIDNLGSVITDFANIEFEYVNDKNHFPNIVISENGNYLLVRLTATTLGLFFVTSRVNAVGYAEKALQLLYVVDCADFVGSKTLDDMSSHITEGGVKTLGNNIAILLTDVTASTFDEYLLIISPTACSLSKQVIDCSSSTSALDTMTAGLTLGDDAQTNAMNLIITTFGLTSDVTKYAYINSLTTGIQQTTTLQTPIANTTSAASSFDIAKQFIHMLANSNSTAVATLSTPVLKPTTSDTDDHTHYILTTTPDVTRVFKFSDTGFDDYIIEAFGSTVELYERNVLPLARRFNLNSDAGFNPCYIGDSGKLVLPGRFTQYQLAKTTGVAIELLGPISTYDDIDTETTDTTQHEYDTRIHETTYTEAVYTDISAMPTYSVYADDATAYMRKRPRLFSRQLSHFCKSSTDTTFDDTLDVMSVDSKYVINDTTIAFTPTDAGGLTADQVGVAYLMFKTGEAQIWLPTAVNASTALVDAEFNRQLFDIIFKGDIAEVSCKYAILKTNGALGDPYIFDTLHVKRTSASTVVVQLSGSIRELVNVEVVVVGVVANAITDGNPTTTPVFMLTGAEFATALLNERASNLIDFHVRASHMSGDFYGNKYDLNANLKVPTVDYADGTYTIDADGLYDGSLVMSITERDSVILGEILPDQIDTLPITGKPILAELLNELYRYQRYNESAGALDKSIDYMYQFQYFQFEYLHLINSSIDTVDADSTTYYVQLATTDAAVSDLDYLKQLTYTAWRTSEQTIDQTSPTTPVENTLPSNVKVTQRDSTLPTVASRPVYMTATAVNSTNASNIIPKLGIRWKTANDGSIELRFDNTTLADAVFKNENNNLTYTSLANAASSLQLYTSDGPESFSIVSPIHIIAGFTVFTDIPLSTLLLTNVSDDKPKFMLTAKSNASDAVNGDAYALVFDTASMPEIENLNSITTHCYVAKLHSLQQTVLPQIDNAVQLKQLAFNMTISNILNTNLTDTVDAMDSTATVQINSIYGKSPTHIITDMKQATATRSSNNETIQIILKSNVSNTDDDTTRKDKCFSVADFFIHFHDVTQYTLKNALISANTDEVLAMDYNNSKLYIAKVFGCDFNKIGIKRVLGTYGDVTPETTLLPPSNIITGTQAETSRNTAILVNDSTID